MLKPALRDMAILPCLISVCLPVFAQNAKVDSLVEIEEVTVLGTRLSTPPPLVVEVITAEQIEQQQPLTMVDALRTLAGITAIEPGGAGGVTEVYLRGADANFTSVFVNGIQLNDPTDARGGAFDFSSLFPGEIRRIEVVRGPFSALYGSGAMAGAISIDTRAPLSKELAGEALGAIGTDGYWQAGGSLYGPLAGGQAGLGLSHVDFGEPTEGSTRKVSSLNSNFATEINQHWSADFTLRASNRERTSYPLVSGGPRLAVLDFLESSEADEFSTGASVERSGNRSTFEVFTSYLSRQEFTATPPIPGGVFSAVPAIVTDTDLDRYTLRLQSRFQTTESIEIGAGLEYQNERGSSEGFIDFGFQLPTDFSKRRTTVSPFVEGRMMFSRNSSIFAGLRYDYFSDVESAFSPRLGYAWQNGPDGTSFTVSWGAGRKSPSFYALGDPLIGNPDLKPEDAQGFNASFSIPLGNEFVQLTLSAYQYDYDNLIDFDFSVFQLVNRSIVKTRGGELRLDGEPVSTFAWSVFIAMHENEVEGVENALLHRPEVTAGASFNWQINALLSLYASAQYEGERPSSSVPGGFETLDSLTRFNAVAAYRLMDKTEIQLVADNVFDSDYEAVAGFPSPGRQFRISVRQEF